MRRWIYSALYRSNKAPWDIGVRPHLVDLVESGRLKRDAGLSVLDLGCGTGADSIYLAERGFDVTGVDFTPIAINRARAAAELAGVSDRCRFVLGDITAPVPGIAGPHDVILDFGALDDMVGAERQAMTDTIHHYSRSGTIFVLWCFYAVKENVPRFRFAGVSRLRSMLAPGEERELFGAAFEIERIESPEHTACFLMTRR
jgi:SAM-dependent methyltransferase